MIRRSFSTTKRAGIFARHEGKCDICGQPIQYKAGESWDVSHRIPLAMGGADDETNWFPVHRTCHKTETATKDIPQIWQAKAREAIFKGAKVKKGWAKKPKPAREAKPALKRRPMFLEVE